MLKPPDTRTCLACGSSIKGRSDKKFCDDYCRNGYNNHIKAKASHNNYVRNINNALLRNRGILESLLPATEKTVITTREKLLTLGFQFKYITQTYTTREEKTYSYCYDYGYLSLENDRYLIVKMKEE